MSRGQLALDVDDIEEAVANVDTVLADAPDERGEVTDMDDCCETDCCESATCC
jgi:hypothetical protein